MTFSSCIWTPYTFFCLFLQKGKKKGSSFSTTSYRDTYKCSVNVYLIKGG